MTFYEYLKQKLPKEWEVYEELNLDYTPEKTTAVLKMQTGTRYLDSAIIPFQIVIYTNDPLQERIHLHEFILQNQNKYFVSNFNEYNKQYYNTPVIPTIGTPSGNQLVDEIILSGILITSSAVSDIKEVEVDGEILKTTTCNLSYSTESEAHVFAYSDKHASSITNVKKSILTFQITGISKNTVFGQKLRSLRLGTSKKNTLFNLKIVYSDNEYYEEYSCVVTSYSINTSNSELPTLSVTFAVANI